MERKENRRLRKYIINHFQRLFFVLGLIFVALSQFDYRDCRGKDLWNSFFKEIGTFLLSTSVLTIAYERWKDSEDKYYLMSEDKEFGSELEKIDLYYYKPKEKIMPILKQDELFSESYSLVNLITKNLSQLGGYTIFIYGTSLSFLKRQEYKDAFTKAIKHGVNFELVMINPLPDENDLSGNIIKRKSQETLNVIKGIIQSIAKEKDGKKHLSNDGFIELRFVNSISPNSFSSVQWKNRYIRTLDFNFENVNQECGLTKYSQIFDFTEKEICEEGKNNNLADNLYAYYHGLYDKSVFVLHYPCTEMTIYVCGVIHIANIDGRIIKQIVTGKEEDKLPKILISAEIDNNVHYKYSPIATKKERDEVYGEHSNIVEYKDAIQNTPLDVMYVQYYNMTHSKIIIRELIKEHSIKTKKDKKYLLVGIVEDSNSSVNTCGYGDVLDDNELWEYFDKEDFMNTFRML